MLFNSFSYAVFLPIVFTIYWAIDHKYRWILLWIASYYFYMSWNPKYVLLILFTTIVAYIAGRMLGFEKNSTKRKCILYTTLTIGLGLLFLFKYFNFFSESFVSILKIFTIQMNPIVIDLLLPVGISFYTFQIVSYVIDVYKGDILPEKHFGYFAVFISFFPQLVAGPIERTRNLLPQIQSEKLFDYKQATYGLKLMTWGFFKKLLIADVVSKYVKLVYTSPQDYHGFALFLACILFTIQIYCDFSGYSDIAIGTAKLLGINLSTNFRNPYFSQSVKEFWQRWHISLSTWLRDYIYIPLGGNRVSRFRNMLNIMATFFISGLWHGANWTFVVWGGLHGVAQIIEKQFFIKNKKNTDTGIIISSMRVIFTFTFCAFAWNFFVAKNISDAIYIISHCFDGICDFKTYVKDGIEVLNFNKDVLGCIAILIAFDYFSLKRDVINWITEKGIILRWSVYIFILLLIVFMSPKGIATEFVYFKF